LRDDRERMRSMILAWLLIALSSLVALIAGDVVAESADTGGQQIEAFGRVLFSPGLPAGAWILAGIGAAGTLLLVTAIANLRGRYLERRMAKEIDDRFEELSGRSSAVGNELPRSEGSRNSSGGHWRSSQASRRSTSWWSPTCLRSSSMRKTSQRPTPTGARGAVPAPPRLRSGARSRR
jgi:hypothetical protein